MDSAPTLDSKELRLQEPGSNSGLRGTGNSRRERRK
jgi:hypothetical protein